MKLFFFLDRFHQFVYIVHMRWWNIYKSDWNICRCDTDMKKFALRILFHFFSKHIFSSSSSKQGKSSGLSLWKFIQKYAKKSIKLVVFMLWDWMKHGDGDLPQNISRILPKYCNMEWRKKDIYKEVGKSGIKTTYSRLDWNLIIYIHAYKKIIVSILSHCHSIRLEAHSNICRILYY